MDHYDLLKIAITVVGPMAWFWWNLSSRLTKIEVRLGHAESEVENHRAVIYEPAWNHKAAKK